ncbi:DUF4870 domain-containing protein [Thalassotalea crassostreae]|uniref:DUF4870 domain-containing protein n=1 Tax=Thalassotalea crassostreae TaxID=1763536 RepID=UPI000837C422|nr:hypothetical protein [Thalassotalea crassostreae]
MTQAHFDDKTFKFEGRTIAILSYFTIVGWIAALILHSNNPTRLGAFHLRQSLGLFLTWVILSFIPVIGWLLAVAIIALWAIALYGAIESQEKELPYVGEFFQQSFNSLIE